MAFKRTGARHPIRNTFFVILLAAGLAACVSDAAPTTYSGPQPTELPITFLPLPDPLTDRNAEISGMAWYGDWLILLPQYPGWGGEGNDPYLYAIAKEDILAYLDGELSGTLPVTPVPFLAPGMEDAIRGYEGYEAIAFDGDYVYMTIEAKKRGDMYSVLVAGTIAPDLSAITIISDPVAEIPTPAGINNASFETLIVFDGLLYAIYEGNGADIVDSAEAVMFEENLTSAGQIPFPGIEWRITDATAPDSDGVFWVMNYRFPLEFTYNTDLDPIAEQYGEGPTHSESKQVERMLQMRITDGGIMLLDTDPIQFELGDESRNWEGLVRLDDRGFLIVTDKYPETLFGFVAVP